MDNETVDMNEVIIRYLDGSASLDEKRLLLQWLKASDANLKDFVMTRDLWLSADVALSDETEVNIALARLRSRILQTRTFPKQIKQTLIRWQHVAAIIFALLGIGYGLSFHQSKPSEKEVYIQNQLITAKGSKGKFILPDGSTVWLNAESKLVYPEQFDKDKRLLNLEGEAYFEVVENKKKPFVVNAGNLNVEVLGTKFDISCYDFQDKIDVVLLSGSVKVTGETLERDIFLKPDQILKYTRNDGIVNVAETKARLHTDWIKERLIFDNDKLSDILISLERWYNISIECPPTLAKKTRMTFTVRGENVEEIFKAMSLITPIRYTISERKVTIKPK
jgi:ferric-dicitrate binding protein FerR (iron transport regulator)